jgi:glycosyltransferase involved in cell wall biosynthesis
VFFCSNKGYTELHRGDTERHREKMKIVYLITGSGGSFYCGNCYRDMIYLRAIRNVPGISATAIPLYLPPDDTNSESGLDKSVFFGAISMYIREKVPFLRNMPSFFDKLLDSAPMLKMAARRSGTTSTDGLEDMTLSMIKGDRAFPDKELKRLVKYLSENGKPEIIHLSNALIIGLARQLKKHLDVKIVCSLLNEDDWIEEMAEPYRSDAWRLIAEEAANVDTFITPSEYYKKLFIAKTGCTAKNIHIIPLAIDTRNLNFLPKKDNFPAVGYFSRISAPNGFDKLVDAFIDLKSNNKLEGLTLHVSGGYTGTDKHFIAEQIRKIKSHGLKNFVRLYPEFQGNSKEEFFSNIDIMSVPVRKHDGYGLYILEANAAGIPVVQPETGAFPEIVAKTRGGITYSPDSIEELSSSLVNLFNDNNLRIKLGAEGKENVLKELSLARMSEGLSIAYNETMGKY